MADQHGIFFSFALLEQQRTQRRGREFFQCGEEESVGIWGFVCLEVSETGRGVHLFCIFLFALRGRKKGRGSLHEMRLKESAIVADVSFIDLFFSFAVGVRDYGCFTSAA